MSKLNSVPRSLPWPSLPARPDFFLISRSVLVLGLLGAVVTAFVGSREAVYAAIERENGVFESTGAALWLLGGMLCVIAACRRRKQASEFLAASVVLAAFGLRELDAQRLLSHSPTSYALYLSPGTRLAEKLAGAAALTTVALALFLLARRRFSDWRQWITTWQGRADCALFALLAATSLLMDKMPQLLKAVDIVSIPYFELVAIEEIAELGLALLVFGHVCRWVWGAFSATSTASSRPATTARSTPRKRAA